MGCRGKKVIQRHVMSRFKIDSSAKLSPNLHNLSSQITSEDPNAKTYHHRRQKRVEPWVCEKLETFTRDIYQSFGVWRSTFSTFVVNFHSQLFSTFLNFFSTSQLFSQLLLSTFILNVEKIVLNFLNFFSTFSTVLNCSRLFSTFILTLISFSSFILNFSARVSTVGFDIHSTIPHRIVPLTATPETHSLFSFSHEISVQMFENATREQMYLRIERDQVAPQLLGSSENCKNDPPRGTEMDNCRFSQEAGKNDNSAEDCKKTASRKA